MPLFLFTSASEGQNAANRPFCPWYLQIAAAAVVILFFYAAVPAPHDTEVQPAADQPRLATISFPATYAYSGPDGEGLYNRMCAACHGMNGQGTPGIFPPVVDTHWVTGDVGRLIRIILHGLEGQIEVHGVTYSRPMPGWGPNLDDEELAALVNYMRNAWGNEASRVTPEEVALVREFTQDRRTAWTAEDFEDEENLGIPGDDSDE